MALTCVFAIFLLLSCRRLSGVCATDAKEKENTDEKEELPGHMLPLGSHMPPEMVKRVTESLTPSQFVDQYLLPKQPVVFEGLMKDLDVRKNWADDNYLRVKFGEEIMSIENGKKENRSEFGFEMPMKEFLVEYKSGDIYMVSGLPPPMFSEWQLPKFLLCGGFTDHLMFTYLWFSSGGTKSVLHTDSYENLHCLVSGRKEFILIEPHYAEVIGPEHEQKGFYDIDVERVDMNKYPNLAKVPWYQATVNEGDCLYLPYHWIHHVSSFGRNMGVNLWWTTFQFNTKDCSNEEKLPDFSSLGDFSLHPELQIKEAMYQLQREDGTVHIEDVLEMLEENGRLQGIGRDEVYKLLDFLEPGCDGVVKNIAQVPLNKYKDAFEFIVDVGNKYYEEEMAAMQGDWEEDYSDPYMEGYGEERTADDQGHVYEGGGDYELPSQHKRDEL